MLKSSMSSFTSALWREGESCQHYKHIPVQCFPAHSCASARRCNTLFVEPPNAYTIVIAFSKACNELRFVTVSWYKTHTHTFLVMISLVHVLASNSANACSTNSTQCLFFLSVRTFERVTAAPVAVPVEIINFDE